MKQFQLQTPISQLSQHVNFFQVGCSEQSNKTHKFQKNHFCDVITLEHDKAQSCSATQFPYHL